MTPLDLCLSEGVSVDIREARSLAHRLLDPDASLLEADVGPEAIAALSAELLPDWYDDWVVIEAEEWRQLRLHTLESLADRLTGERRFALARRGRAGCGSDRAAPRERSGRGRSACTATKATLQRPCVSSPATGCCSKPSSVSSCTPACRRSSASRSRSARSGLVLSTSISIGPAPSATAQLERRPGHGRRGHPRDPRAPGRRTARSPRVRARCVPRRYGSSSTRHRGCSAVQLGIPIARRNRFACAPTPTPRSAA